MAPKLLDDHVRFRFSQTDPAITAVTLDCDRAIQGGRGLGRTEGGWELRLPRPPVQRLEYRLTVTRGGASDTVLDPDNPLRVATAFGDRSVLEMPGYVVPQWLRAPTLPGSYRPLQVRGETRDAVPVTVWSPEGMADSDPMPLLLVHDGPEYDVYASIVQFCSSHMAAGSLPQHRVALAQPVERDAWYSGSPQYLRTEVQDGLDLLSATYAVRGPVVVMGASLGGLTAVLAGLLGAPRIGGVFSQSGSFFQARLDGSERDFTYFDRISRVVTSVLDTRSTEHPLVIGMTCGAIEENAANNAAMAAALRRAGHDVSYRTVPDLHSYTAWRDALQPDLADLLQRCWSPAG